MERADFLESPELKQMLASQSPARMCDIAHIIKTTTIAKRKLDQRIGELVARIGELETRLGASSTNERKEPDPCP